MSVWSALAAAAAVLLMATLARPALRGLPEPVLAEGEVKAAYADLATTRFLVVCASLAGVGVLVPALTLPGALLPTWWVLAGPTLLLAAVDARTTWTPLPLQRVCSIAMVTAVAVTFAWTRDVEQLGRTAAGASAAFVLFWLLRNLTGGGMGYGDVRAAPVIGAAAAATGWSMWVTTFLLASLVGTATGVVLAVRGRRAGFALVPAMVLGAYLACAARWLHR